MTRYDRPGLELEFDQQALTQGGCYRYVPIVLRLCGVPVQQHVILTVSFERMRKQGANGTLLDDYDAYPLHTAPVRTDFHGYYQHSPALLARPHDQETGTIRCTMTSQSCSILSQAIFRPDSRGTELVQGSVRGLRLWGCGLLSGVRESGRASRGDSPPRPCSQSRWGLETFTVSPCSKDGKHQG